MGQWQRCEVCSHAMRETIEKACEGAESVKFVADRYGMSVDMLQRHLKNHLFRAPAIRSVDAVVIPKGADPATLFKAHNDVIKLCEEIYAMAKAREDVKGMALGVRELRCTLDQQNKMLGLYEQVDPKLQQRAGAKTMEIIARALAKFPEAKEAVLKILAVEDRQDG